MGSDAEKRAMYDEWGMTGMKMLERGVNLPTSRLGRWVFVAVVFLLHAWILSARWSFTLLPLTLLLLPVYFLDWLFHGYLPPLEWIIPAGVGLYVVLEGLLRKEWKLAGIMFGIWAAVIWFFNWLLSGWLLALIMRTALRIGELVKEFKEEEENEGEDADSDEAKKKKDEKPLFPPMPPFSWQLKGEYCTFAALLFVEFVLRTAPTWSRTAVATVVGSLMLFLV